MERVTSVVSELSLGGNKMTVDFKQNDLASNNIVETQIKIVGIVYEKLVNFTEMSQNRDNHKSLYSSTYTSYFLNLPYLVLRTSTFWTLLLSFEKFFFSSIHFNFIYVYVYLSLLFRLTFFHYPRYKHSYQFVLKSNNSNK